MSSSGCDARIIRVSAAEWTRRESFRIRYIRARSSAGLEYCPPKAGVARSNRVGRANLNTLLVAATSAFLFRRRRSPGSAGSRATRCSSHRRGVRSRRMRAARFRAALRERRAARRVASPSPPGRCSRVASLAWSVRPALHAGGAARARSSTARSPSSCSSSPRCGPRALAHCGRRALLAATLAAFARHAAAGALPFALSRHPLRRAARAVVDAPRAGGAAAARARVAAPWGDARAARGCRRRARAAARRAAWDTRQPHRVGRASARSSRSRWSSRRYAARWMPRAAHAARLAVPRRSP